MNKNEIRKKIKKLRNELSDEEVKKNSLAITTKILNDIDKYNNILVYMDFNNEVKTNHIIDYILKNKTLYLPKVLGDQLTIHKIDSLDNLQTSKFGILEPINESSPYSDIDLIIAPGVAFDNELHRLGYGGGYYDRLLSETNCPVIGIAYDFQILEKIPFEAHDKKMNKVITDKRIIKIGNEN